MLSYTQKSAVVKSAEYSSEIASHELFMPRPSSYDQSQPDEYNIDGKLRIMLCGSNGMILLL